MLKGKGIIEQIILDEASKQALTSLEDQVKDFSRLIIGKVNINCLSKKDQKRLNDLFEAFKKFLVS